MGILGFIGMLIVTIVIVAIVEAVSKTNLPYGWLGNIVAGLIGGWLGQVLIGPNHWWTVWLAGVPLLQTFIGSLVLILVAKFIMGQIAKARK